MMERVQEDPPVYRFYFDRVPPGDYRLTLLTVFEQTITVVPGGPKVVDLEAPPLCPVTIRLKRDRTDIPLLDPLSILWHSDTVEGPHRMRLRQSEKVGEYLTELPEGLLTVEFPEANWIWAEGAVGRIRSGPNLFEPTIYVGCVVKISLTEAGQPLTVDESWLRRIRAHAIAGNEVKTPAFADGPEGRRMYFKGLGAHRFVFPPLDGYQPIEPVEVHLAPGQQRDLIIPVTPDQQDG